MKILFVDDSRTVCAVYVSLLTEHGYKVYVAHSMEEAIAVARRERPQLAVIDFYMPNGNGDELTRALLQDPETASMVIAIHSQFPDVVKQALKAGAVELIGKDEPKELFMMRINALRSMVEAQTYQRNIEQLLQQQDLDSRPISILMVDDSPTVRAIYGNLLGQEGFQLLEADTLELGRTIARVEQPDMMLVDYMLPDGHGDALVRELLQHADTSSILMVMFSHKENLEQQALDAGAIDIISKEESHENFLRRINAMKRYVKSQRKQRQIMLESRKQISTLLQRADQANRAKDDFLATMSHELRTPLTAIIGNSGLLAESRLSGDQQALLQSIEVSGRNLLSLVNDILDLSKIGSGKFEIDLAPFDLPLLLQDLSHIFSVRAQESGLVFRIDQQLDPIHKLWGDGRRITQVLVNLLGNAVKFTEQGEVSLTVYREEELLCFAVEDSGIGMSAEVVSRLFQPFEQADSSISRRFGGIGLGLHISAQLAKVMKGGVSVSSEEGKGSRFLLALPYRESDLPASRERQQQQSDSPGVEQRFVGEVLIVEDAPELQLLERRILESVGATVTLAENGEVAVELALTHPFDLILMDMQMPVMDGIEATRKLRNLGSEVPIVALTANVMQSHREQFEEAGASGFLQKPINRERLEKLLNLYLRVEQQQPEPHREGARRLLVVDDEEAVLELYRHALGPLPQLINHELASLLQQSGIESQDGDAGEERSDFELTLCHQGEEAVSCLRQALHEGFPFPVAFIDMRMPPGIDGLETARALRRLDPRIYIVFVSAYTDVTPQMIEEHLGEEGVLYLDKPFSEHEILQLARILSYSWERDRKLDCHPVPAQAVSGVASGQGEGQPLRNSEAVVDELIDDELMQIFAESIADKLQLLQRGLSRHDWNEIRSVGHNIKGTAATFGEPRLSELGKGLQSAIDESRMEEASQQAVELLRSLESTLERLRGGP